jgi:predicted GIY-YIG superfamily endonuclease
MTESDVVPTAVYRFYDDAGQLLYVGITSDLISRWREHEKHSPWWPAQRTVSVVWRDSREEAHAEECNAIATENRAVNTTHTPGAGW